MSNKSNQTLTEGEKQEELSKVLNNSPPPITLTNKQYAEGDNPLSKALGTKAPEIKVETANTGKNQINPFSSSSFKKPLFSA